MKRLCDLCVSAVFSSRHRGLFWLALILATFLQVAVVRRAGGQTGTARSSVSESADPNVTGTARSSASESADPNVARPASPRGALDFPCSACHTTTAWRAQGATAEGAKFDHSKTGFPLTGEHIHTPCVACHNNTRQVKRACVSCHEDFHRGRLSQSCDTCHSPAGWNVTRPIEIHRMTRFPLTGMHVLADCTECHIHASELRWTGAPVACFACHEKDYRRPDLFPVHVGIAATQSTMGTDPFPRDCSLCHRAVAWAPVVSGAMTGATASPLRAGRAPPPSHDLRFPISFGVHRAAGCDDCHASLAAPRSVRCIGCHAHDPVRLAQQHRQPVATDGASCLTCHPGGVRR
jgi:hypothetical protein